MLLEGLWIDQQYLFELKDKLIRDNQHDSWKEIPLSFKMSDGSNENNVASDEKTVKNEDNESTKVVIDNKDAAKTKLPGTVATRLVSSQ